MAADFTFIVLTFNEEMHLPRLLNSLQGLEAAVYILDSGSTDQTIAICNHYGLPYAIHAFENHPKQWHEALRCFEIKTPWVIALDADQTLTPELYQQLALFKDKDYLHIDGIYFNRKNIFQGKWIRYGGYYPVYMLKMFRYGCGYSDLSENMDHRFIVPGKTTIWKKGHLLEENLKENKISFWIDKHNRYSDLLATEEIERKQKIRLQTIRPLFWGTPDQRRAWLKRLWWSMPHYSRAFAYFSYRMLLQKGIFDGRKGILFHFLQGFWFRLIVDMKIDEQLRFVKLYDEKAAVIKPERQALKFAILFPSLFMLFYYFNIAFIGVTTPGGYYVEALDNNLNYIKAWRDFDISCTAMLLRGLGYEVLTKALSLQVSGKSGFILVYSCLGYGILSVYAAFVLAYPKPFKKKLSFLVTGIVGFQAINIMRLCLIALYWKSTPLLFKLNAHEVFNYLTYALIICASYCWLNYSKPKSKIYEKYTA